MQIIWNIFTYQYEVFILKSNEKYRKKVGWSMVECDINKINKTLFHVTVLSLYTQHANNYGCMFGVLQKLLI